MGNLLTFILAIVLVIMGALYLRTIQLNMSSDQQIFATGTSDATPNGFYSGSVMGPTVSWQGKRFNGANKTGVNVFADGASTRDKYPFTFTRLEGSHDPMTVIAIDYNLSDNPWWLRPVLDEIVEVAPGKYLGKLELRLIPSYPFTLTFFRLSKSQ